MPFECDWPGLVDLSATWITSPELEGRASEIVRTAGQEVRQALIKPYEGKPNEEQLSEDFYIVQLAPTLSAAEAIAQYGAQIAQIVRGELQPLSDEERAEVLLSRISYYPNDMVVVGWTAALVYDTADGGATTIQLLEYANSQLLEFRHYDQVLTGLLSQVYALLSRGTGFFARWKLAREAGRLNAMRLEVRELTERVDNSIKFLSDTFAARVYRLAAARIGVPDYRTLVDEKLRTAGELYQFMMDGFYQSRGFVLELLIVIILVIELVDLFVRHQ